MAIPQPFSSTRSPQPSDPYYNGRQPFVFNGLRTLKLSCASFPHSNHLFSIACALFDKNTGGGIPRQHFVFCAQTQTCLSASPLLATLTHSLSRNPFACHSYANTRDGGATRLPFRRLPDLFPSVPSVSQWRIQSSGPFVTTLVAQSWCNINTFRINTCKTVSKQTTLTSFRINTYEKPGGRGALML